MKTLCIKKIQSVLPMKSEYFTCSSGKHELILPFFGLKFIIHQLDFNKSHLCHHDFIVDMYNMSFNVKGSKYLAKFDIHKYFYIKLLLCQLFSITNVRNATMSKLSC